jgi:hypothetical protein
MTCLAISLCSAIGSFKPKCLDSSCIIRKRGNNSCSSLMDGSKGNAEEDAYHVTGDLRSPKIPRISPDGSKDREFDRRGREDKSDWDS